MDGVLPTRRLGLKELVNNLFIIIEFYDFSNSEINNFDLFNSAIAKSALLRTFSNDECERALHKARPEKNINRKNK